jgi:hypothetical protein
MSVPVTTPPTPTSDLSLGEMLRIMDVARAFQKERDIAREQFSRDEARALLRKKLLESKEITGDEFTDADVEAALDQYFNNLHTYHDPPAGISVLLAHLYIRRTWVVTAVVLIALFVVWKVWN